jgi:hypothetical protein
MVALYADIVRCVLSIQKLDKRPWRRMVLCVATDVFYGKNLHQ